MWDLQMNVKGGKEMNDGPFLFSKDQVAGMDEVGSLPTLLGWQWLQREAKAKPASTPTYWKQLS
jgi:hypothetical protein